MQRSRVYLVLSLVAGLIASGVAFGQQSPAWKADIDVAPGAAATQPDSTPTAALQDPFRVRSGFNLNGAAMGFSDLIVPTRPGKFLLITGGPGYELWNLKTGAREKSGTMQFPLVNPALSPDGQYLAGMAFGPSGMGIQILSTRTDKVVSQIATNGNGPPARIIGFCGTDRIAIAQDGEGGRQTSLRMYAVNGGGLKGEIAIPTDHPSIGIGLSATGKYLAVCTSNAVQIIDTTTAKSLGTASLPKLDKGASILGTPALAFSPDGKELAVVALISDPKLPHLQTAVFSAASGELVDHKMGNLPPASISVAMDPAHPPLLTWSPNGTHLLLSSLLLDRNDLSAIQDLAASSPGLTAGSFWVDPSTVLLISRGGPSFAVKEQKIANSGAVAQGGAASAGGGHATGTDIAFDANPDAPWKFVPAALPAPKTAAASITIRKPAKLPAGATDNVTAILYSSRAANTILVAHAAWKAPAAGTQPAAERQSIERYDLATGAASPALEMAGSDLALDVSPSGDALLFRTGNDLNDLTWYSFSRSAYQPAGTMTPFGPVDRANFEYQFYGDPNAIQWGGLIDDSHALVLSQGRSLALIDLAAKKTVWRVPQKTPFPLSAAVGSGIPALSPDRKVAAVGIASGICLIESLTGKTLNFIAIPDFGAIPRNIGFSSDGTRLAALTESDREGFLHVWDLKTGQRLAYVPVNTEGGAAKPSTAPVVFLTPSYVLTGRGSVVNVERNAVAFNYLHAETRTGSAPPQDRLVYLPLDAGKTSALALATGALPHDAALKAFTAVKDADLYAWHPGMSVRLDLTVVGGDDYRKKQLDLWTAKLKDHGITVDDNSPNTLHAKSFLMQAPPTVYHSGAGSEQVTLTHPVVGFEITLTVGVREIWRRVNNQPPKAGSGPTMLTFSKKPGETAQQAAEREYPVLTEASQIVLPPEYIAAPRAVDQYALTAHGPDPVPDTGLPSLGIPPRSLPGLRGR